MTPWKLRQDLPPIDGARVTVMGLGLFGGGAGAARFLASRGAKVTVTDLRSEKDLRESIESLGGLPIDFHLGGHREEDFAGADWVLLNPAIAPDNPWIAGARSLETEMNLFVKLCRARTIAAVTGSNGKTTTTALIGEVLKRGPRRAWVGGNIGVSLLDRTGEIARDDVVVLELSSFQLEHLDALRRSPNVSVVMNLTPNHLDRHGTMEAYVDAKRAIVRHQRTSDWKVLNGDDPVVSAFASPSGTVTFGSNADIRYGDERIRWRLLGHEGEIDVTGRRIPGTFNLQNMAAAAAASRLAVPEWAGWEPAAGETFRTFPGVEHRLEFVGEFGGVKYYNDSIATNPESTLAALETLPGPFVLLAGGYDKKLPFEALGKAIASKVRVAVLMGPTAPAIAAAIGSGSTEIVRASTFEEAVGQATSAARPGETVLLSPACASFDMFRNFAERGARFKALVKAERTAT